MDKKTFALCCAIRELPLMQFRVISYLYENGTFNGNLTDFTKALGIDVNPNRTRKWTNQPNLRKACKALIEKGMLVFDRDMKSGKLTAITLVDNWCEKL